jgi:outer membrane protein assembly factor BamE (lipoprotein component of BamABCDE complex)
MSRQVPPALLLALVLYSCASYSTGKYGHNLDDRALSHLEMVMPKSEVKALLGTPYGVTELAEGRELWTYYYKIQKGEGGEKRYEPIPPEGKGPPDGAVTVMFFSTGGLAFVKRQ